MTKLKRTTSFIISIIIVLNVLLYIFANYIVVFASGYDVYSATKYAVDHAYNYNDEYRDFNVNDSGGDCANFVSQCLVKGGNHGKLNGGLPCRGYPCGFEEVGAKNLGDCLKKKGWTSKCGKHMSPPSNIQAGDVLIYHAGGCDSYDAHAVLITKGGSSPKITCHSSVKVDNDYNYMSNSKPYYQWLHHS